MIEKRREQQKRTTCMICGKPISNPTWQKKYCSKCRQIKDKEFRKKVSASE